MNYKQFEQKFLFETLPNKESFIRNGQALINQLREDSTDLYKEITATINDCFYDDRKIPVALLWIESHWDSK